MSQTTGDISWQVLRRIVQDWAGTAAELSEVCPLDGGSISTTLLLTTNHADKAVLKISPYRVDLSYENERHDLQLLGSLGIPVPKIYQCRTGTLDDPNSYIVMEFMPGVDLSHAKQACTAEQFDGLQRHLAELVIALHCKTSDKYGRAMTGKEPDTASWPQFFRQVYDPTVAEVQKLQLFPQKTRKLIGKVHERLEQLIRHSDVPRLNHCDLWSSNLLCWPDEAGNWRITAMLDPICKYAHAETEIAYLDLFHTSTPVFSKMYQQQFKLDETYHRVRKPIYQFYPLLNHVCVFGAEYVKPLMATLEKVSALV